MNSAIVVVLAIFGVFEFLSSLIQGIVATKHAFAKARRQNQPKVVLAISVLVLPLFLLPMLVFLPIQQLHHTLLRFPEMWRGDSERMKTIKRRVEARTEKDDAKSP